MSLPQDPMILLSYVNTKLRDEYPSLHELCQSLCEDEDDLRRRLAELDHQYDETVNRLV